MEKCIIIIWEIIWSEVETMLFNENMSSKDAQKILFDYAEKHRGEDMEEVKKEYREVLPKIIRREMKENEGWLTE